ncbi:glycosyltransferase family 4 protein [Phormidium tenue FACHB-886]|nr:glycosyltransferase family 4 protein [Phormidium tenue FACHB-886]
MNTELSKIAINLSLVGIKPTGLATYAKNLIPHLGLPNLTLFASSSFPRSPHLTHYPYCEIPANLTAEQGKAGHFRRLVWTQQQLPLLLQQSRSTLLFSPVPEAPLSVGVRSIVVVHDLIPLRFPRWTAPLTLYARFYVPQVLAQAQHVICNSEATAEDVVKYFQIPAQKVTPILLAHDAENFRVIEPITPELANPQPVGTVLPQSTRPYFFYLGRVDPYKNLHRVISAFAALPNSKDYELWIAGSADLRYTPLLQAQARELKLDDRIKFLEYVPYAELPVLLNRAIALVFPSLWEGFGFPVLEAMACGTPVITSNLSSLPEVAGDAALLVDPYRETEITAAMQTIATDAAARSQLRSAGLARASQFSWEKTGQATAELLQQYA